MFTILAALSCLYWGHFGLTVAFGIPTKPFAVFEPRNPGIDELCVVQQCRSADFGA